MSTSTIRQRPIARDGEVPSAASNASNAAAVETTRPLALAARPVIPGAVLAKLILFSVLLFVLPIGTYFATLDRLFGGNPNYSAIAAVVVANLVVVAYVVVAFLEDQGDPAAEAGTLKVPEPAPAAAAGKKST
ncbi:hypothetical protein PhCBS80983_g05145 [Powellomyces hirtus]|uniref:Uncharacterized protein n=1 Tax=Powellomyces hirtus TaxID=109895 RepID=A0A507DXQ5_9FUNG|nr:hypothetical protein PhCBS80983_g05145 [Powellomyces hirtus]